MRAPSLVAIVTVVLAGLALIFSLGACGVEEEVAPPTATATQAATPVVTPTAVQPSPTPAPVPTAAPTVQIPADWQTYVDPKGRFSIRVPADWRMASYASEEHPAWVQFNIPGENEQTVSHTTDGVKLEIAIIPKQPGETIESKAPLEGLDPRLSLEPATVNGLSGIRQTRGLDAANPTTVGYVFQRGSDWIAINLYPTGPRTQEYTASFEELIVKSFVIL